MQKLKLNLESLNVDSFETTRGGASLQGTVQGHQDTLNCSAVTACNCNSTIYSWSCVDANTDTIPDPEGPRRTQFACTNEN
jgi:hypothetical protein